MPPCAAAEERYTMKLNTNYNNLKDDYLFADIGNRVAAYKEAHPDEDIIRLGIGDVTRPLAKPVVDAMVAAAKETGSAETFRGYGPYEGYEFLREGIRSYYGRHGVQLGMDEIFVSDGAKGDVANFLELFSRDNTVLIPDPVYPVYVDANVIDGRRIEYLSATRDNAFTPLPDPAVKADIIYLCSPNNPTGAAYTRTQLAQWVKYAYENEAVILFDAAYESFIVDEDVPHSIYEVEGAREVAVEICSLSKTAGFTGTRCGYTIVPKALRPAGGNLNAMWLRRLTTKFNGTPYVIQRAAEAVFTSEGLAASLANVEYYKQNAAVIAAALDEVGIWYSGGKNSPYIWLECPGGMKSWDFFDLLLQKGGVVGTPGAGFGKNGEGYFRLTGFGDAQRTKEAAARLQEVVKNL